LRSEPKDIAAALDAAISGRADKERACMKALLIPEARMMFVSPKSGEPLRGYRYDEPTPVTVKDLKEAP
jgi:hypothetical protein